MSHASGCDSGVPWKGRSRARRALTRRPRRPVQYGRFRPPDDPTPPLHKIRHSTVSEKLRSVVTVRDAAYHAASALTTKALSRRRSPPRWTTAIPARRSTRARDPVRRPIINRADLAPLVEPALRCKAHAPDPGSVVGRVQFADDGDGRMPWTTRRSPSWWSGLQLRKALPLSTSLTCCSSTDQSWCPVTRPGPGFGYVTGQRPDGPKRPVRSAAVPVDSTGRGCRPWAGEVQRTASQKHERAAARSAAGLRSPGGSARWLLRPGRTPGNIRPWRCGGDAVAARRVPIPTLRCAR